MDWWLIGTFATSVAALAYLALSFVILRGLRESQQLTSNPLALATGLIFLSCGLGHGVHAVHAFLPAVGIDVHLGLAAREIASDWHVWLFEGFTAGIAVWYWTLRRRFPALLRGTAMFEDLRQRQRQALEIHDNVVQGLAKAKLNLELGRTEEGMREIEDTLKASRAIITDLLGDEGGESALKPGELRRGLPAGQS
ncbi:MAG TPA: hypothetical protein VNX21_08030 [Candidatus Thermoplasmatota archaeon]|nr:hypothetical protein [Candidatus Thermoplasmatota archaeon]